jgi:PTS system ascorbate-specific IIA component
MLKNYLSEDRIKLGMIASDWRDLVKKVGKVMQDLGDIDENYTTAMLNAINDFGPYSVVSPGVVLLHARPENGVNQVGLVIITLQEGVMFGSKNDPVKIAIGMSAIDNDSHLEILQDLAIFLQDATMIKELLNLENEQVEEALEIITNNHNKF